MSALDQPRIEVSVVGLLRRLHPKLKALLKSYRIPDRDAEELLHQILMALVYQGPKIREPQSWLLGTLRNRCRLYWRSQGREMPGLAPEPEAPDAVTGRPGAGEAGPELR